MLRDLLLSHKFQPQVIDQGLELVMHGGVQEVGGTEESDVLEGLRSAASAGVGEGTHIVLPALAEVYAAAFVPSDRYV